MGNFADDFLTRQKMRKSLGSRFEDADSIIDAARDLATRDKMPLDTAVKYVSGQKTRPYGSPSHKH